MGSRDEVDGAALIDSAKLIGSAELIGSAALIERLRREGGFRLLPLLGNTGAVAGVHLSRFLPGGQLDVIQAWDERWAAYARLPDSLDVGAPFVGPVGGVVGGTVRSGPFARVVAPLLPIQSGIVGF